MNTHSWYASKTTAIMEKYACGDARVHYHLGFPSPEDAVHDLRTQMHLAQERLLVEAFDGWTAGAELRGTLLDVGCGLGGTSLWLAQHHPQLRVTGLTNVAEHAELARGFAVRAGVADRVSFVVGDAHEAGALGTFDVAVCFEAANLFDRARWLASVRARRLWIDDYFVADLALKHTFDEAFAADIGRVVDYVRIAQEHGFTLESERDVSAKSLQFWRMCADYADTRGHQGWHQSSAFHLGVLEAQRTGRYVHSFLAFAGA